MIAFSMEILCMIDALSEETHTLYTLYQQYVSFNFNNNYNLINNKLDCPTRSN